MPSNVGRRGGVRSNPATLADDSGVVSQLEVDVPVHSRTAKLHVPSATPSASHLGIPVRTHDPAAVVRGRDAAKDHAAVRAGEPSALHLGVPGTPGDQQQEDGGGGERSHGHPKNLRAPAGPSSRPSGAVLRRAYRR